MIKVQKNSRKNLLLVIPNLDSGGAERVVSRLSVILSEKYKIYIALFDGSIQKYSTGGIVLDLKLPPKSGVLNKLLVLVRRVNTLRKIKKEYNIHVSISFLETANIVNILSRSKAKTILSVRNYKSSEKSGLIRIFYNLSIKTLFNKADYVIAVSKLIAQDLNLYFNIKKEKISVIYNPFNVDEIETLSREKLEPHYQKFMTEGNCIISMGRLTYQKGYWHLIKSFMLVKKQIANARLVIIGTGPQESRIKKLIDDLNLKDCVMLVGHQSNPFQFIKNSKVYVMSSLYEGFPNSLVEAMACGKPVISTDCKSGPREILYKDSDINLITKEIEYADYGLLVPPLTETEDWSTKIEDCDRVLSNAIIEVLSNTQLQTDLSKKSSIRAKHFDNGICKKMFTSLIDS